MLLHRYSLVITKWLLTCQHNGNKLFITYSKLHRWIANYHFYCLQSPNIACLIFMIVLLKIRILKSKLSSRNPNCGSRDNLPENLYLNFSLSCLLRSERPPIPYILWLVRKKAILFVNHKHKPQQNQNFVYKWELAMLPT